MAENKKILIVDDDPAICELIESYLKAEGFHADILESSDSLLPEIRKNPPHLILLDIMLPGKNGFAIFKDIKSFKDIPILFVTAKTQEIDRLLGLELGADDYICKPFYIRELVARVKVVLHRTYQERADECLMVGPISMDIARHKVKINDVDVHLTPIQFNLLRHLMAQPDCVLTRRDLINKVQGYDFDGYDRTIDNHIRNLRVKIGAYLPDQEIIRSVYGIGYSVISPKEV